MRVSLVSCRVSVGKESTLCGMSHSWRTWTQGQNPKTRKESIQKLYTTTLLCKHEFQVSYFRYTVKAVGHWSVWDICYTGRGTAGLFQAEQEAAHWQF